MSPPVTFISSPHPESFVEHRVFVCLRDKVAGSALKNNQKSQTPAWLFGQCGQLGQGLGKWPPQGPCYRDPDHSAELRAWAEAGHIWQ